MSSRATTDTSDVKRRSVKVIKSRLEDIEVGDVVNRQPDAEMGWFVVNEISTLFNGHLQLADETEQVTVSGSHKDMVGLQLVREVELDDRGLLAAPAPAVIAAPPPVSTIAAPPAPSLPPSGNPVNGSSPEASHAPAAAPVSRPDPVAEAAAAAEVATRMKAPPGVPAGVNLALVAELLEDLDVGEAPSIDSTPASDAVDHPARTPLPEGTVAVFGDTLPAEPSYKNPVVVPEGAQLPRRSRAA